MNHMLPTTANHLRHLNQICGSVVHSLTSGSIDIAMLVNQERELREATFRALATLADTTEKASILDSLVKSFGLMKLGGGTDATAVGHFGRLVEKLCAGHPGLEVPAKSLLIDIAELGRIGWTLRLLEHSLAQRGPAWARSVVDRVRSELSGTVDPQTTGPLGLTVQLTSKVTLECIMSSPACSNELRSAVMPLLQVIDRRLDGGRLERGEQVSGLSNQLEVWLSSAPDHPGNCWG